MWSFSVRQIGQTIDSEVLSCKCLMYGQSLSMFTFLSFYETFDEHFVVFEEEYVVILRERLRVIVLERSTVIKLVDGVHFLLEVGGRILQSFLEGNGFLGIH